MKLQHILFFFFINKLHYLVFFFVYTLHFTLVVSENDANMELVCAEDAKWREKRDPPIKRELFEHFFLHWRRFWRNMFPMLPGEKNRARLEATQRASEIVPRKFAKRMAQSECALEPRAETCLEKYQNGRSIFTSEPYSGMELNVYYNDDGCSGLDISYELQEPIDRSLGAPVRHAVDYAYTPVITSNVEPIVVVNDAQNLLIRGMASGPNSWWQWWVPWWNWNEHHDHSFRYRLKRNPFAGGSHGEVWRGRRKCRSEIRKKNNDCEEVLIFKRLRIEKGYRVLEAGLREVYFGGLLARLEETNAKLFTRYIDHFFRENGEDLELWIVFVDAGPSLRSFLYTGSLVGDYIVYHNSRLWTQLRMSVSGKRSTSAAVALANQPNQDRRSGSDIHFDTTGRQLMQNVLRQILMAASILHANGIVHRDIKPSNVMCQTNLGVDTSVIKDPVVVDCALGDFSSALDSFTKINLYTRGPSQAEQTDEYAPPEAIFGHIYGPHARPIDPAFDSWSVGVVALELLLGTPNVFSVDQRTRSVLTNKMQKVGASEDDIEKALYLAALSQFCIYNPRSDENLQWPLRRGDPLYQTLMTKESCTLDDFHRSLRARDPLGLGFETSDSLLHLIWQLLEWNPKKRITAAQALLHPYFSLTESQFISDLAPGNHNAIESLMLDPRMDFNLSDSTNEFVCPHCSRKFQDWQSCQKHARSRRHAQFCTYDRTKLPTCINAHAMLPADQLYGHCDIQGRRKVIEDFHAVHLDRNQQFYGILDGHTGNLASKYVARVLYPEVSSRISEIDYQRLGVSAWKAEMEEKLKEAFETVHKNFLKAIAPKANSMMDQSGTTATVLLVTKEAIVLGSLGDSRAVISRREWRNDTMLLSAIQLTHDHTASDPSEKELVESRGGVVEVVNGIARVNGTLVVTRSIGDAMLAPFLSREPDVLVMTREEVRQLCGSAGGVQQAVPCFIVLASDGLWDVMTNEDVVNLVGEVISSDVGTSWRESASLQHAAEVLTLEAYVRGSTDNIGVCIVSME